MLATLVDGFTIKKMMPDGAAQKYPHVLKVKDAVFNVPQVKAYLEKRPHTDI